MSRILILLVLLAGHAAPALAQAYDIVIKGGHVIDPRNGIDRVTDVALAGGKVARVADDIDGAQGRQVVTATGLYVIPGIIDLHAHGFHGTEPDNYLRNSFYAISPDGFTFRTGVTTFVDAGSSGWKTFPTFKAQTIDRSQTRVLAFLNIVGEGMRGGAYEQDTGDMDARLASIVARRYAQDIVGFKVAHFSGPEYLVPIERAIEAGGLAGDLPIMLDGRLEDSVLQLFRPGDIFTHTFGRAPLIDESTGRVSGFVHAARDRGVVFDVGYGGASFDYPLAKAAASEGFFPDVISTDIHGGSMNTSMKDILSVMSKFLALGMELQDVVTAVTWKPAQVIGREELGNLSVGSEGDVTVVRLREGEFGFYDRAGVRDEGTRKFEAEVTIKGGKIYYDLNGLADPVTTYISGVPQ